MTFTPSQAVVETGLPLETLRYYERIGLLDLDRTPAGRRVFSQADLDWIGLLRCLRETGMPIAAMLDYAGQVGTDHHRDETSLAAHRLALLRTHDRRIEDDLARLTRQRDRLREKISWYQGLVDDQE